MTVYTKSKYVSAAIVLDGDRIVDTPYCRYEFDNSDDAHDFYDYLSSIPKSEYDNHKIGCIIEHCYFLNRGM